MDKTELLDRLRQTRAELGTSRILAERLGIPEGTLKAVLSKNFNNQTTIDGVLTRYSQLFLDGVLCPYVDRHILADDCHLRASSPKPFGGAAKLAWWQCCQSCPNKPTGAN